MANLIREIIVKQERRQVAVRMPDGSEKLGFFHKWSYDSDLEVDYALIEATDGTMEYATIDRFRFLPIGNEIPAEKLEAIYRENGILKG